MQKNKKNKTAIKIQVGRGLKKRGEGEQSNVSENEEGFG